MERSLVVLKQQRKPCAARSPLELAVLKDEAARHSALHVSILKEEIVNREVLDRARQHLELEGQVRVQFET